MAGYPPPEVQKEIIRIIAKSLRLKLYFRRIKDYGGYFYPTRTIVISCEPHNEEYLLETFFHELGHWYCYHHDIYKAYHKPGRLTRKSRREMLRTATRAELFVDHWGEQRCAEYFPEIRWEGTYRDEESQIELIADLKKEYKI